MKPLVVTSGEPAGIGPDLCLTLSKMPIPLVVFGDKEILAERAKILKINIQFQDYNPHNPIEPLENRLTICHFSCANPVVLGQPNPKNAPYVLTLLKSAIQACLKKEFSGLVTAPIHKEVINLAGIPFSGHTEFLAEETGTKKVVMMLACEKMKVALMTTHLPLSSVPKAITEDLILESIPILSQSLQRDFGLLSPQIAVAGLNPHAGEGGYLGLEEKEIISPALYKLRAQGFDVFGPFSADTLFSLKNLKKYDAFVTMYHDQGLPVLKYAGFGEAVNISLGLPLIRTSVDHGTALELAGTGQASASSLVAAVEMAYKMARRRGTYVTH